MSNYKHKQGIKEELAIPEGITIDVSPEIVTVRGPKGELKKKIYCKEIVISIDNNLLVFSSERNNKKLKKMIGTYMAHTKNMFKGVKEGHIYLLKICSGHFPMNVSVSKNDFIVKNLLGEKIPRVLKFNNVDIKVEGDIVTVESIDKESAGQYAAAIEQLTKRSNYDTRIFQDGIYITSKDGKEIK